MARFALRGSAARRPNDHETRNEALATGNTDMCKRRVLHHVDVISHVVHCLDRVGGARQDALGATVSVELARGVSRRRIRMRREEERHNVVVALRAALVLLT